MTDFQGGLRADTLGTARVFLDIFHYSKNPFDGKKWTITEKKGITTATLKTQEEYFEETRYTIDRNNWYMSIENNTDGSSSRTDLGMYFRKDRTPIIAVSRRKECFGPKCTETELAFYECRCAGKSNSASCELKDITSEIFPAIRIQDFLDNGPEAKKLISKVEKTDLEYRFHIKYIIPRVGTTIKAVPWLDGDCFFSGMIDEGKDFDRNKVLGSLFSVTCMQFNWVKNQERFIRGESKKNLGLVEFYGK